MTDYNSLKVPDLKKLLGERSLPISGNKSDLIARLQEHDKKPAVTTAAASAPAADDEIDWDEDDTKAAADPASTAVATSGKGQVANPIAVPNQKLDVNPATTKELKVTEAKDAAPSTAGAASTEAVAEKPPSTQAVEEAHKQDFALGIKQTDAEKEAEKRAARAKRFGITEDDEEKKKVERAKKFGTDKGLVVKGLDDALPERRAKRGREGERHAGRAAKRQTPDRRTEAAPAKPGATKAVPVPALAAAKKTSARITDDPAEKAKAEARAKRFQTTA